MKYIFIGGVPRSGTSLVQKILSFHPKISAGPEFDHIPEIVSLYTKMKGGVKNGRQSFFFNEDEIQKIFKSFIDKLFQKRTSKNTEYISEKTPSNALVFENLIELDNSYKLIFVVRDPRGIIASMREVAKRAANNGNKKVRLGNNLLIDIRLINKYYQKVNNTKKKYPNNVYIIYYENILEFPERTIKKLCDYLNLEFLSQMLDTSKTNEISQLVDNQTIASFYTKEMYDRKISKSGVDRWKDIISEKEAQIIQEYFAGRDIDFLKNYSFQKQSIGIKMRLNGIKLKYRIMH
jgi:hypothetical protein